MAVNLYLSTAKKGHQQAAENLAVNYEFTAGIKDYAKGLEWAERTTTMAKTRMPKASSPITIITVMALPPIRHMPLRDICARQRPTTRLASPWSVICMSMATASPSMTHKRFAG